MSSKFILGAEIIGLAIFSTSIQGRRKMFQVRGAERRRCENRPGGLGACSPRKVLICITLKRVFLHFGVSFSL